MDKKTLMESLAREAHEKGGFNGAWLYAEHGEIVSKGAMGFRDPDNTLPIQEDTIFQLASVSKQFTATAVMLLLREGLLCLEDKITKYFPELTAYEGVTVRHLLTHTGGVPDYFDDADWFINIWKEEHRVPGNDEIIRFLCETELKPSFAPGEKLEYSNTGYNLLALLVERLSGVPYEAFLQKNIFEPAGMSSTCCCHIRRDGVHFENYARASVIENGRYVADMGTVLTLEEQQLMYTPAKLNSGEDAVYDEDEGLGYGFGWGVGRDEKSGLIVSHSGGMPGVITWFERWIDADRVLVMLFSRDPWDYRAGMGAWNGLRAIAADKEPEPIRTIEEIAVKDPDKSKWEGFCGKYEHPEDEDFFIDEVWLQDGELYARAVSDEYGEFSFRLYPLGENEFGRKSGMLKLTIGDGCVLYDEYTCKKL